jgi:hypothetical protein
MAKSVVLYGDSGTWKTTQAGVAAIYLFKKWKLPIRLVTAEESQPLQPLVEAGIIDKIQFKSNAVAPFAFLTKLSQGWWKDGKGIVVPPKEGPLPCAGYIVEGLTSIAEILIRNHTESGRKISQDVVGSWTEDGLRFGQPSPSHYGNVQNNMLWRISDFTNLQCDRVIFTSHEAKGEEESSRTPIRGAGLVGQKGTDKIPKLVGSYIHAEYYGKEEIAIDPLTKDKIAVFRPRMRYFFVPHPDPKLPGITYPAKPRLTPNQIPRLMEIWPGGYFTPTLNSGLDEYLRTEDELEATAGDEYKRLANEVLGEGVGNK